MKTVELMSGQGPWFGPVLDMELNPAITEVSVTVRTMFGDASVALLEATWDNVETWQPMAVMYVDKHSEKTLTAKPNRDSHELVQWNVNGNGRFYVRFDVTEGNENE
jgi:hypothetical protein